MKRAAMPEDGAHWDHYEVGEAWCGIGDHWVALEDWHRQFNTPSPWVGVCRDCFEVDDQREGRVAPDAVHRVRPMKMPEKLGALLSMMQEDDGE